MRDLIVHLEMHLRRSMLRSGQSNLLGIRIEETLSQRVLVGMRSTMCELFKVVSAWVHEVARGHGTNINDLVSQNFVISGEDVQRRKIPQRRLPDRRHETMNKLLVRRVQLDLFVDLDHLAVDQN